MNAGLLQVDRMLGLLGRQGSLAAADLAQALDISRATLSRAVAAAGDRVVRMGRARDSRYALRREIRGESSWPVYRIDTDGAVHDIGTLTALHRDEFFFESTRNPTALLHAPFRNGYFPGLPWFLDDQRPQGFLGRTYAHRMSAQLQLPEDLKTWTVEHGLVAILHGGSTQVGDLLVGDAALRSALAAVRDPADLVTIGDRASRYAAMARDVMRGEPPGSSPAGEQPKFTATIDLDNGARECAIIKFSDATANAGARRWAALLRCEAIASEVLAAHGASAAASRVLEAEGFVFLESRRFDRAGRAGRRGYVSLAALDADFYGHGSIAWWKFADDLERDGWISAESAAWLRRISWFGNLIANSDMHLGNQGLMMSDQVPFELSPVFDMLPMLLRPTSQGIVVDRAFDPLPPASGQHAAWRWAVGAALEFWQRIERLDAVDIDDALRDFAGAAQRKIAQLATHFR